jgi:hypothetical protein
VSPASALLHAVESEQGVSMLVDAAQVADPDALT